MTEPVLEVKSLNVRFIDENGAFFITFFAQNGHNFLLRWCID